ncbi:LysR family transcriptional regulator [Lysinibacillus odysseyi]|uniref:HTH lysR-type domain-containing protein n=1 Tax=Lysinibacillus odysseyi 34hs-1 = NBRC 100172 TaxID=1220589 RepID=A0A0A3J230_9BACI|nr:LysR family transcriptional regulator [Lysinibacillus odysseyi]KGR89228.1 hypothetical protein CD32_00580 [Lysinibacillus odysseyi 34hs-1 = NBRC 100172]
METKWIKSFLVAAETENFRRAAEILHLSQPSITVHIGQLEDYLGVQLFERNHARVKLTPAGHHFLPEAKAILERMERSVQEVRNYAAHRKAQLTIVISPLLVETIIPHLIYQFSIENTDCDLILLVEESDKMDALLLSGKAQLAVGLLSSHNRAITSRAIHESPLQLVAPLDEYDDESGQIIEAEDLFRHYPFFTDHIATVSTSMNLLVKSHFPYARTISISQSYIVKRFIRDGLGISFLPKYIIRREMMEGRFNIVPFEKFELPTVKTYLHFINVTAEAEQLIQRIMNASLE